MASKFFLVLCASALLVQKISTQCAGPSVNPGIIGINNYNGIGNFGNNGGALAGRGNCGSSGYGMPTNGRGLSVSVSSPIAPSGITVISENTIEGALEVVGQLPVLATVAVEGVLPSGGSAGTTYSCGNGQIGINEAGPANGGLPSPGFANGIAGAGFANAGAFGPGIANAGLAGSGIKGCGVY